MHSQRGTVIALLLGFAVTARAQQAPAAASSKYKPCSLVTKAETEALTGQTVTSTTQNDVPYTKDAKHDHDGVVSMCMYTFAPGKGLTLVVSSVPVTPEGKASGAAHAKAAVDKMKKMGTKVEEKKFGDMTCSTVLSTGNLAAFSATSCGQEKGSLFFALTVSKGQNGFVSMDKLHALAVKVVAHLP